MEATNGTKMADHDFIRSGYLRQILDILPMGILILQAPAGNIVMANPEMEKIHKRQFPLPIATDEYMEWRLLSVDGRHISVILFYSQPSRPGGQAHHHFFYFLPRLRVRHFTAGVDLVRYEGHHDLGAI